MLRAQKAPSAHAEKGAMVRIKFHLVLEALTCGTDQE